VSIDELGREAGAAARRTAQHDVDPGLMLQRLHRTRRTRSWVMAAGAAAAAVVLVLVVTDAVTTSRVGTVEPAGPASASASSAGSAECPDRVQCLSGGRYRIPLQVPLTVSLPDGWVGAFARFGDDSVEDYLDTSLSPGGTTGVTIMENAKAVAYTSKWTVDPSAGTGALGYAEWFVGRPFLQHTSSTMLTVDGRTAYVLQGSLRPDAALVVSKADQPADPTFRATTATAAISESLRGVYVVIDTPPAGVTVVWFWSFDPHQDLVLDATTYLKHLHFG
jgi:hypothetical protein